MLPSHKIKMAGYYVKNKQCFCHHLGLNRHFDFLAWQKCFYYIALEVQDIKKREHFIQRLFYNKILNFFEKYQAHLIAQPLGMFSFFDIPMLYKNKNIVAKLKNQNGGLI
jgi:hypothetical protein